MILAWPAAPVREGSLPDDLPGQAHVWLAHARAPAPGSRRERYESLLSDDELVRYRRLRFERDRVLFLVAHALVRTTLSRYADTPPRRWSFRSNRYGRPEIDAGGRPPPMRFNLSHAHGLAACVVTRSVDCGVDVEGVRALDDPMKLAARVLSGGELAALEALPSERRTARFFDYWTLKESYVKARGMGVSLPLGQFGFRFEGERLTGFETAPALGDDPAEWQFSLGDASDSHRLAVALRRGKAPALPVVCRFVEP